MNHQEIMTGHVIADSVGTAVINTAVDRLNLTEWLFTLSDDEYKKCAVAHIAAGATRTPDGKRVSMNVENPEETPIFASNIEGKALKGAWGNSDLGSRPPRGLAQIPAFWAVHERRADHDGVRPLFGQ